MSTASILTIDALYGGTTNPSPGTSERRIGDSVTIKGLPNTGFVFSHWEIDGKSDGYENPLVLTLTGTEHRVRAHFESTPSPPPPPPPGYAILGIFRKGFGQTKPVVGYYQHNIGVTIQVTANPSTGSVFDHWELSDGTRSTEKTLTLTIKGSMNMTAYFHLA